MLCIDNQRTRTFARSPAWALTLFKLVGTVESPQHLTVSSEITPVETIAADAQQNDVYSITGIRQNTGRTNLRSLSRGVYIVNGKKVVVK